MTRALVGLASLLVACASLGETAPREASLRVHAYWHPTYELTLHASGEVEWTGIEGVDFVGVDVRTIDADRVAPIFEAASVVRWDLVPPDGHSSPNCGSCGQRLMWTFDDGETVVTGYDDQVREQPFSVDGGPACIAPELLPLREVDARVDELLGEIGYVGGSRDWPNVYVPMVGDEIMEPHEVRREQRERIGEFVREAWVPVEHVVHLQIPAALAGQASAVRRRFVRAGVPERKLAVWVVPKGLAHHATARVVPERCVEIRGPGDAVIDCPPP